MIELDSCLISVDFFINELSLGSFEKASCSEKLPEEEDISSFSIFVSEDKLFFVLYI